MSEELIGQSLGRFRIKAELGEGGMGLVFKAHDPVLTRDVAVKVMHAHLARQPGFQERFLQEARTAAHLDHPNIVKVYDFGQAPPWLYIVMEFIPGSNLRQILKDAAKDGKWVALGEAIELVRQVSLALDYAHRQGVLHRDIKPDNIMLKNEPSDKLAYRPVVTDLGLAKLREGGLVTSEGVSMGTPAYMSPEQARGEKTDVRSDVYSLGVLLYELAVGQLPFSFQTITQATVYYAQKEAPPPPAPRSIRADLPEAVEGVILRALQKDPADRFPDAKSLADALAVTLADAPVTSALTAPGRTGEMGRDMDMKTVLEQSLVKPRGTSILKEFPKATPPLPGLDRIQILASGRTGHSVEIRAQTISVGRRDDNDLVLDDPKVSGHHAQIKFDGTDYQVLDLDSTNGTYLANVKLLPGLPQKWTPDTPLRMGDHWLRLLRAQPVAQPGTSGVYRSDGTMVDAGQIRSSAGQGRVGVFMEQRQLAVDPGGSTTASLIILNQGTVVDHFQVSVQGIPAEWIPTPRPAVELMPGHSQEVRLSIQVPRAPRSQAGKHPMTIRVTSQDAPDQAAEERAELTVTPYHHFVCELHPQRQAGADQGDFQLTIQNRGNASLTVEFEASDAEEGCDYLFTPRQAAIPAGGESMVRLRVRPKAPLARKATRTFPFTVSVRPPSFPDMAQPLEGVWEQTSPAFDLVLKPPTQRGTTEAKFGVEVSNQGNADLTVAFEVEEPEQHCRYTLTPPQILVPAGQTRLVHLKAEAKGLKSNQAARTYPFTVTARPAQAPELLRQVYGDWEQAPLPAQAKTGWGCRLVLLMLILPPLAIAITAILLLLGPVVSTVETPRSTPVDIPVVSAVGTPRPAPVDIPVAEPVLTPMPQPGAAVATGSPSVTINQGLNVRTGPGIDYDIIGAFSPGATADIIGRNADSTWWQIPYPSAPGGKAWISAVAPYSAAYNTDDVPVVPAPPPPITPTLTPTEPSGPATPTIADYVSAMPRGFRPDKAGNLQAVYQFQLIGDATSTWTVSIASGACLAIQGPSLPPAVTITMSESDFIKLSQGQLNTMAAYNQGKVKINGDLNLAAKLPNLFGPWANFVGTTFALDPTPTRTPTPTPSPTKPLSGSCLPGFDWRLAGGPDDKVCVPPASRAQAQADNAAADSRREVAPYGPDTCKQGYVWRGAFTGDHVCVTPDVYDQAQADNAAAASRALANGPSGPGTCVSGYVWRQAREEDHVCVIPEVRAQAWADNAAAAASRKLLHSGPDTCKQGYVWRGAFTNDHVCVTYEVYDQVQEDNSLAPSRTVP